MSRFRVAVLIAALATLPLATGCAKRITETDASYTQIEGVPDQAAQLTAWGDTPIPIQTWSDVGNPPGPSPGDILVGTEQRYLDGSGQIRMMLIDGSRANGFQMMRVARNGGFEQVRDFVIQPTRKWVNSQWETYRLTDPTPSGASPAGYQGRGLVEGTVTTASPLTNLAQVTQAMVPPSIQYLSNPATNGDSLISMSWSSIPGAAGYWLQVYQFRSDATAADRFNAAAPSPIFDGRVRDNLVAYVTAPNTSYRLGSATGAMVLTYTPALIGREYEVRITAVSATGEVLAYSAGSTRTLLVSDEEYLQFPSGAFTVNTSRIF